MPITMGRTVANEQQAEPKKAKQAKVPRSKLPSKRTINLAASTVKRINWGVALPSIVLIVLAAGAFSKFAVIDRFAAVSRARGEAQQLQAQLDATEAEIESYGELNERYAHYTTKDMTDEELARVNRVDVLNLLRRRVRADMKLDSWSVSGNILTLTVSGNTLQEVNKMMQSLMQDDLVDFCTVSTAQTDKNERSGEEAPAAETVSAVVIVYLKDVDREAKNG